MDNFQRLLKQCELLKKLLRDLEYLVVDDNQKTIREIQLRHLREELSRIGRQLNQLSLYKRDEND